MINRPVNSSGLTGLLYTTSPYTLPSGTFEIAAGVVTERSYQPDYSVSAYPLTISYGLNDRSEIAIKAVYWKEKQEEQTKLRGVGDTELSFKWNVLRPKEYSARPVISFMATGIFPTGDRVAGTNSVIHWGARGGLSLGSEIPIGDYIMGIYGDLSAAVQDLSDKEYRDWYHTVDAGILLPISKYRNLQMFVEYNRQNGRDIVTLHENDYSAITYGLRLVNVRFNFTIGVQFIHKYNTEDSDTSKLAGLMGVKF